MAVLIRSVALYNDDAFTVPKSLFLTSVPFNPSLLTTRCHLQNSSLPSPLCAQRRLAPPLRSWSGLCLAAKPGPSHPKSDPKSEHPRRAGFEASLSKFQDRVQIFFGVLFWMSLFFWTCAWDDRNRPNKGSRFRR